MIVTREHITDPQNFVLEDPGLVEELAPGQDLVVTSPNIDLAIRRMADGSNIKFGDTLENVSGIFKHHYREGNVFGMRLGKMVVDLQWFPSPRAVNELSESIGLTPGKDVLRFTHSEGANISASTYTNHLAAGEYPQSTSGDDIYFEHDRADGHAIGTLLTPPAVTANIIRLASEGGIKVRNYSSREVGMARSFDTLSDIVSYAADRIWPDLEANKTLDVDRLYGAMFSTTDERLWGKKIRGLFVSTYRKDWLAVTQMFVDHLAELKPKIDAL